MGPYRSGGPQALYLHVWDASPGSRDASNKQVQDFTSAIESSSTHLREHLFPISGGALLVPALPPAGQRVEGAG